MSPFIERLGWVLVHSLWQLALLAAAAFVVQRAMQRSSAAARYAAMVALLVLVVAAPLITWSVLSTPAAIPVAELPDPVPARASEPAPQLEPVAPALAPAPVTVESTPPITAVTPVPPEPIVPAKAPEPLKPSWSQWAQQSITPWLSTIVWGWSLGVLAFAIRPLWSWFTVRQLRTQGVSPVSESVQAALAETARRLGMTQAVRVLQSTIVQVPVVAGYLKPVILLPASIVTGLPASQLEAILAHELAHIRRHDYLANLIQTLVETVFFYHPAVWWLSHQIRCERENCCDDIAVAMLGNRLDYSRALLAVEELRGSPTTLAVGASGGSLLGRVRRLFHRDVEQLRLSNGSITLCGLIGIGLIALAAVASTNHDGSSELFVPGAKAEIEGFGTIEVLGLRFVDSEWWSPDGSNLSANVDLGDRIRDLFNDDPMNGRQIGIVTRFSGVDSPSQSRVRLKSNRTGGHGSVSSQERRRAEQNQITDIRFCSTNLSPDAVTGELTVLLSFDAWSPWYTIDLKSPEASQNEGPLAPIVGRTPSSLAATECEIGLQFKSGVHEEIHFEQIALDAAGNEIPIRAWVGNNHLGLRHYAVPESQVAKLRYRLQRFTHEVRFRDISLKAGRQTEPQARVQVLHRSTRPAAFSEPVTSLASWPQLGGSAAHNPISPVTNLPTQFHLDRQENIRWYQPIGDFAFSSPVVSGGKVLIGTNNAIGRDPRFPASIDRACLQCFDERTGEFLWQYSSPKMEQGRRHDWPSIGICSTPVIEGDRVWFATNRCEIVCLDLNGHRDNEDDGEPEASAPGGPSGNARSQRADVVWKYDMFNTLGVRPLNATCVTPVIAGDLLLLNSGNDVDESYVNVPAPEAPAFLAFHKITGQLIWSDKTPNSNILGNGCSMGAPAVAKIDGVWQAIFAGYDGWLYAFDLECIQRGETLLLWKFDLNPKESQYQLNGPRNEFTYRGLPTTPVVVGDHVFAAVGHNPERGEGLGRLWCIDATKRGDLSSDLVYNKSAPDVVVPHKRVQACEPDKGDFTRPNPNSGVEWVYTTDDLNKNGQIEFEEQMHLSNSLPAIHDGLLLTTDLSGLVHCLDVTTGELLWTHDQLATCWSGPLLADGKAWVIDEDGDLSIFALSREKQLIAEIAMNSPGYTNFAAANQTLYVATKTQLVAIGSGEFPKPNGVTAKLPGGLEIELVGVTPNSAATTEGWRPDGSPIAGAGDWPRGAMFSRDGDRFTVTTDSSSKLTPDPLARDVLFECRGATSSPSWTITRQGGWTEFQALNVESGLRRRLSLQRKDEALNTTVEMAYTDSPWGPWQRIGADGKRINSIETFAPDQLLYNDIRIERVGSSPNQNEKGSPLELVLNEPATGNDYQSGVFAIEVRLISKSQKVLPTYPQPQPMKEGRRTVTWRTVEAVPLESLQCAEFRLRPYRHFITFENVPLEKSAAEKTTVKHRSIPEPPRRTPDNRFVARLPDGMEIELLRIVRNDLPEEQSWLPNGEVPTSDIDWPNRWRVHATENGITSSSEGPGSDRVWDVAYAYRPTSSPPLVSVEFGGGSSSSATSLNQVGLRTISLAPKDPAQLNKLQLRVGNEPWGQWIQVDAEGGILNPAAINEQPNSPDTLIRIVGAGIDEENPDRSWIKWLALPNADQLYSMEVRAIDDDGNIHEARHRTHGVTMQPLHEMTYRFELSAEKLKRFEYRTRPYRHLVRFDQICTDPAKPTEVKVSVDRITYPEEVVEILPIEKSRLLVLNPDNTPWQGSLVAGHIGFIPPDTKAWNAWVGKDGQADLSALPAGKHWLISRYPWSVIPIETPLQQSLRQPLRLGSPPKKHSSSNYSGNLSIQRDEQGREFIQCDFYNNTDELWSFSELDLTLEAGWFSTESHGHSPQWLGDTLTEVPQIEIAPGQKGSLRIDWSEWAKRGVWDPMSGPQAVSKPVLPDQEPGKIWVRISGPGFGTNPVAVTHPDKLVAVSDEPAPQPPAADEFDGPRIDLIGLTYDSVPKKETWNTNGQPLPAPDWVQKLPKLYGDDKSQPAPLYLFEVHGLRAKPSFRHRYQPAVVSGDDEPPEGRPYRMAVLYEDLKPEERNQFILWGEHPALRMTDEPWGPWRTITKEGQFAEPIDPNTLYREGYDMVTLHGFRPLTKKPNDPEPAPDAIRTGLVLKHPMDYDALYAIEIEAVPSTAGPQLVNVFTSRPVQRFRNEAKDRWDVESEWPVDPTKIDHLRYRIRPYRHRFEFQEVAYKQYERPATSAPFKVIHTKLEHDLPKTTSVKVSEEPSPEVRLNQDEKLNQVEQLFEKVSQNEREYGDFEVIIKKKHQANHEPQGGGEKIAIHSSTVEQSLILGRKYQYRKFVRMTFADNQTSEMSQSDSGECYPQTLQAGSALRPHQLLLQYWDAVNGCFLVNRLKHFYSNGRLSVFTPEYRLTHAGEEPLRGLDCVKVRLLQGSVLRIELWLAKERHLIPIRYLEYLRDGTLSATSEVTEFQELNPGRWFPKRFETIKYNTDFPGDTTKISWREVSTLERYSAMPVWAESDLSQIAKEDQPPVIQTDLKDQASGRPASSELVRKLSAPDQSVRDQAAAQLKTLFKPTAKAPWQAKIDAIAKDTPRAEVFAKLGIDEKRDLYAAINTTEDYRLDDTWMIRITFTSDLQKSVALELIELLHRPWVDPPADFTGTWVTYYVSGVKAHEIDYRNGKYHGRHRSYHANGQLLVQQHYTDQVANGEDTGYFASGKLMYRGLYEDDKQVGPWIHYNEDGSERSRTEHPQPTRPKTSGKLLTEIRVVDDATGQPVTGGKVTVRWSFDRHALEISGKPVRNVFDVQEEFNLTEQGTFPIRIPAGMEDAKLHVQESVKHPDYVIEQSFGHWSLTPEMVADPALLKAKLFAGRPIKLKRGHEVSGLVTDGLGQPVAGVRVYAAMQMPEYLNMPPHAVTDTQGRYKFRVPEHDGYQLMFVPADRDKSAAKTDKPADLTTLAQVNLVAQSIPIRKQYGEHPVVKLVSGTRIVGVVRDSAGRPLPNIVVQANDDDSVYMGFPNVMSRVVTDAEGRYELPAQKLPVDVRIARHNQRGGWSEPASIPADVYLPEFVTERWGKLRVGEENVYEVDFAPVKTVTFRARAYNAKGQPDADAEIELVAKVSVPGAGPDQRLPQWRRTFTAVPGEVGLYELKAPQGLLDARIDLTGEGLREPAVGAWTRAAREEEKLDDPRTRAAWPVLDRDDDSIIIGEPAAVALNPPGADARFPFLRNRHADRPGL